MSVNYASLTTTTRSMTLPRVWQTGIETNFHWSSSGLFSPLDSMTSTVTSSWTQQRSSPAAFVVTRPHPAAYARLDRANAVFAHDMPVASAYSSYRVYEHPTTGSQDSAVDDVRDYGGWSQAASLLELRATLQTAGQCTQPVDSCMNTELLVNFDNSLTGQYWASISGSLVAQGSPISLSLFWTVNDTPTAAAGGSAAQPAGAMSGTVASGSNASACVPVVPKDWSAVGNFSAPFYLHVFVLLEGKYFEVSAPKQMMNNAGTGVALKTALDSGQSHAVTMKCYNSTPTQFIAEGAGYTVPDPNTKVTCVATPN